MGWARPVRAGERQYSDRFVCGCWVTEQIYQEEKVMANPKALRLLQLGFQPVLLGNHGDDLKRPILSNWQTAIYTPADVALWPATNNIGIRCGRQLNGRILTVLDFDEEANRIFPAWRKAITRFTDKQMVIVTSSRGCHVYLYIPHVHRGCTLAGRNTKANGRPRLHKFIETIGTRRQIVTAGSRHPSGWQYCFAGPYDYRHIPILTEEEFQQLITIARTFDERPPRPQLRPATRPETYPNELAGISNCLEYARTYLGGQEKVETNGDIRFLGYGGLLITADGLGWYAFSDDTGGGLAELAAWHQALTGQTGKAPMGEGVHD